MKILYIHQYFKTPLQSGSTRSYWISKALIEKGHEVTVISGTTNKNQKPGNFYHEKIKVKYFYTFYNQKMSVLRRAFAFFRFTIQAINYIILNGRKFDLIYATSTPLTTGIPALFAKYFLNKPFVFEVRDVWPEVPIQMGAIRNQVLIVLLKKLESLIYRCSSLIITLSPDMTELVKQNTNKDSNRIHTISNMSKIDLFWKRKIDKSITDKYKLDNNAFKVVYFGAIGRSNGLMDAIKLFELYSKKYKASKKIQFIIIGNGSEFDTLKKYSDHLNYLNIKLIAGKPLNVVSELVNSCDASLISFLNIPILNSNSPNKLFDSLSAELPIIVNSEGWTKSLVEKYQCGVYYKYGDFISFEAALNQLQIKRNQKKFSKNARELALTKFDKSILCEKVCNLIEITFQKL